MSQAPRERSDYPKRFFSEREQQEILEAIRTAELVTSGEIRFHVERDVPRKAPSEGDAYRRAREVFASLGMHRTEARNGVLVYLATRSRRFAVVGDEELHRQVGDGFWEKVILVMAAHFDEGKFGEGVATGILMIGQQLREHFPHRDDDVNELDDGISFGDYQPGE